MLIRWDSLLVRHLATELDDALEGARLRAVRLDAETRDAVFLFRRHSLIWRLHPTHAFPLLRDAVDPADSDLRLKARVRRVRAPVDDRILVLELVGEGKGAPVYEIVVELLGNQLNAIVTEGHERMIRHVLRRRDGARTLRVGEVYDPPEPTGRAGTAEPLSAERWLELLEPVPPPDRARTLVRSIAWSSPLNASWFLGDDPTDPAEERDLAAGDGEAASDLLRGHARWLRDTAAEAEPEPRIVRTDRGPQPYPFSLGGTSTGSDSLLEAIEESVRASTAPEATEPAIAADPDLLQRLDQAVDRLDRRVVRLQAEFDGRDDPEAARGAGDLILARYQEVEAQLAEVRRRGGADETVDVELTDFDRETITLGLDPRMEPHANAERYYHRATRSERAARRLPPIIERTTSERDRLAALRERARAGSADADEIRSVLPKSAPEPRRSGRAPSVPYRSYRSSGGLEIRVGRGARHNDDLTFHHSSPDDVWLHARHTAGAHVILRWNDPGSPPARDLAEAAALAALHSKARTSGSVPVDWTLRKYVRKPRGSAPGSVVPDRVQTVFVAPDESLMERLATDG